jgi:hypothetical protein
MAFASMGNKTETPPRNGPYCFQIYHLVSMPYPNKANKPGHAQLCIFVSADAKINGSSTN